MTLGEKIYKYRKQAGLSQEELAFKLNVTRQSVSLWETDQTTPTLESLKILSDVFAVSLDDLCDTSPDTVENQSAQTTETNEISGCGETKNTADFENFLASLQTKYSPELVKQINKTSAKKSFIGFLIGLILSIFLLIGAIVTHSNTYLFIFIICVVVFATLLIRLLLSCKKRTKEYLKLCENGVITVKFFQNFFNVEIIADNIDSKSTISYGEIKKVENLNNCILVFYGNTVIPIEKNLPNTNYDLIFNLLNVSTDKRKANNTKVKALLITMLVISISSIFMALATIAICISHSPLPDFPFSLPEYCWIFFIFIPLPLASTILGFVFLAKKYKCKKNIVAGIVMCVLLAVYGSFTFIFTDSSLHDFSYVSELERTVMIDLPDSGYISRATNPETDYSFGFVIGDKPIETDTEPPILSFAMIKFDDADEMARIISNDGRFVSDMSHIPHNFIYPYYLEILSDYDYFMIFDVETNIANYIPSYLSEDRRFICLAYNKDKNILFVLDFIKRMN